MKKLNKAELEALADKILTDMKNANQSSTKVQKALNLKKNISKRDELMYELNNMSPILKDYVISQMSYNSKEFMKPDTVLQYIENQMMKDTKLPYRNDFEYGASRAITNELVLAQIEAENLDELISKVQQSFKGA